MKSDYIAKTIAAYDKSPQKFLNVSKDMMLVPEVTKFLHHVPNDGLILDVGCGYGKYVKVFSEKGYNVIGIDFSEGLLKEAKNFLPTGDFRFMDMRKLEFNGDTFSGVWATHSLLHLTVEDIEKTLKEIYRVLKKDGIFFVTFKKGEGSKYVKDLFTSNDERFYTYLTEATLEELLTKTKFYIEEIGSENEQKRYGKEYRDQDWVYAFAIKK